LKPIIVIAALQTKIAVRVSLGVLVLPNFTLLHDIPQVR
jgi:hypothetical protein